MWILLPFAIIAIYFRLDDGWDGDFMANGGSQSGTVNKTWFALFQVVSKWNGTASRAEVRSDWN